MGGLIPLLLPATAAKRVSVIYNPISHTSSESHTIPVTTSSYNTTYRRQSSLPAPPDKKRVSISSPPVALPILPFTPSEWKKAITEVKKKYVNRKYRTCLARCCEILDHLKETSNVEPLYVVYLHFYAASSFEMCARPLSQSSSYRTKLLRDARDHYELAACMIKTAEEEVGPKSLGAFSPTSSVASSLHSPSMSVSSQASTESTALSSPRYSLSGLEDTVKIQVEPSKPAKKKVSFSSLPEPIEVPKPWQNWSEPYVRPDSPTLGWEEDYFIFGPRYVTLEPSIEHQPEVGSEPETPRAGEPRSPLPPTEDDTCDLETFLQTKNKNRFCAQLSALRSQVSWHRDAIDVLLTQPDDTPDTPALPEVPPVPALLPVPPPLSRASSSSTREPESPMTPPSACVSPGTLEHSLSSQLKERFGSASSFDLSIHNAGTWDPKSRMHSRESSFSSLRPLSVASTIRPAGGDDALKARIERMRANGWQRKRFEPRRYEALRKQVLNELGP